MKYCIVIGGPTAAGKTQAALALARYFDTEIISADSRQCYRELHAGVAKPTPEELESVRHYFIDSHSIHDTVNAAVFEQYALWAIREVFASRSIAVVVGGTGLYIKSFTDGIDNIPGVDENLRKRLRTRFDAEGIRWLEQALRDADAAYAEQGEMKNPQRMLRALEVKLQTGNSILTYYRGSRPHRDFNIIYIAISQPRQILYDRINRRVDDMLGNGLEQEARELNVFRHLNALQTVGYQEFFPYFDGEIDLATTVDRIKQHTRNYAKRQLTWFRRDTRYQWFDTQDTERMIQYCTQCIH